MHLTSGERIDVSVLIPAHNRIEFTSACLDSLFAHADPAIATEIIVVNDCSNDGTESYLESQGARIRVISNRRRRGFGRSMNDAAHLAQGEFLCLLNNDTLVTPGWLTKLLAAARNDPKVGVVGNLQITPATGKIDHAGVAFDQDQYPLHLYRDEDPAYPPASLTREFQAVTAACCLIPRVLFLKLGGFDPAFRNGYEDIDFCLRVRQINRKVLYVGDSLIYHHGRSSPGRMDQEDANREYFRRKWRRQIEPDYEEFLRNDRLQCDNRDRTSEHSRDHL